MIQLYAVTEATAEAPEDLAVLDIGGIRMLYRECDSPPACVPDDLLQFGLKVQQLAERCPALPARYGSVLDEIADLRLLATTHEHAWTRRLRAVAGAGELIVHLHLPDAPDAPRSSGRAYLLHRADELRARSTAVEDLTRALSRWAREHRELPGPGPARLAVLVDLHDVEAFRASLTAWADGHPGLRLDVTGPWPPFSFCEDAP